MFEGQNILDKSADRIAGIGIARTFQNLALFRTMRVSRQCARRRSFAEPQRFFQRCGASAMGSARGKKR